MIWAILAAAIFAWIAYEIITAPTMDEQGHVISDPYHRVKGRR